MRCSRGDGRKVRDKEQVHWLTAWMKGYRNAAAAAVVAMCEGEKCRDDGITTLDISLTTSPLGSSLT